MEELPEVLTPDELHERTRSESLDYPPVGTYSFFRETDNFMMSGNGMEFLSIRELKEFFATHTTCETNWSEPGYKWEIEKSWYARKKWHFLVVERGVGEPGWAKNWKRYLTHISMKP